MEPALHGIGAKNRSPGAKPSDPLTGIRVVLGTLDLDCRCRGNSTRPSNGSRVGELDTLSTDEADLSVFQEIALLFEDIKAAAMRGAEDMIRAGGLDLHGGEAA